MLEWGGRWVITMVVVLSQSHNNVKSEAAALTMMMSKTTYTQTRIYSTHNLWLIDAHWFSYSYLKVMHSDNVICTLTFYFIYCYYNVKWFRYVNSEKKGLWFIYIYTHTLERYPICTLENFTMLCMYFVLFIIIIIFFLCVSCVL